jgi:hypothetical protein
MSTSQEGFSGGRSGWQFSLGTLLVAVVFVAVTCVALKAANEIWAGVASIVAVGSLLVAVLVVIYRTGRARAFAVGFAVFGTGYLFVSSGDTPDVADAHCQLPTTRWAIGLYTLMHGNNVQTSTTTTPIYPRPPVALSPPPAGMTIQRVVTASADSLPAVVIDETGSQPPAPLPVLAAPPPPIAYSFTQTTTITSVVPLSSFLQVIHNSLILLLGVIGGIAAQMLDSTRPKARSTPSSDGPGQHSANSA